MISFGRAALDRLRRRTPRELAGYEVSRLQSSLGQEGCPICREVADHDRDYFFWYFNEGYFEPHHLDWLTRSVGFCRVHGATLTATPVGAHQLAAVHAVVIRRLRRRLIEDRTPKHGRRPTATLAASGPCPPCRSRAESVRQAGFWINRLFEQPDGLDQYGHPGLLCFPHLQTTVLQLPDRILERVFSVHHEAFGSARKKLGEGQPIGPGLHLAVGDRRPTAFPRFERTNDSSTKRDPVADFIGALSRDSACAICLELGRAWREWAGWLEAAVHKGNDVHDLLPACPEHVWGLVGGGSIELATTVADRALHAAAGAVELALLSLRPATLSPWGLPMRRMSEMMFDPPRRRLRSRDNATRALWCGVCRRLATAEERAFILLFALMEDARHQAIMQGYGLCLKHLVTALSLEPPSATRRALLETESARLATIEWELDEMLRKGAWDARPETKGAEGSAWWRAVVRLSGSWTERS